MLDKRPCFLGLIGIFAGLFVPFLAAQTAGRHAGQDVKTFDLIVHPDSLALSAARRAFLQGDIVRIVGGNPEDLQRLLGIGGATLTRRSPELARNPGNALRDLTVSSSVYQVVAARATRTGALHAFQQRGAEAMAGSGSEQLAAYELWVEKERRLAQNEETGSSPTDPGPPAQAWTELQQTTYRISDQPGNVFQNTVSIFRLNDISLSFDWYMVLTVPESQPNYLGCRGGTCGWWTTQRVFTMSTNPQAVLFDHGPLNTITSDTASFSIGGLINSTGPGVNAGYSVSWPQKSVTTTDQSDLVTGVGKWNEAFEGNSVISDPPETSTGLFLSHQGSIFQVPEGTTSFQFSLDEPDTSIYANFFGYTYSPISDFFQVDISPPIFETSLSSLSIPPGGSGDFEITAVNPSTYNSGLGLAWDVTNLPSWLTVSQTSGSSSARLILNVAPGTALGTVASINVNTDPAFAAPSVEKSPLLVRVTVGQPNETGVMLTGGTAFQSKPQALAQLYSPQLGQFDFGAAMQSPRSQHTATLLLSGELLLAGGAVGTDQATATAETFDPNTAQFSSTSGMMTDNRESHTATLLQNGTVLLAGGIDNLGINGAGNPLATAELYDPVARTFRATGSMAVQRLYQTSTGLLDGEVLITGGASNLLFPVARNTAEIYDPNTGRFTSAAGNMISGVFYHTATRLKDGHVLIAGGLTATGATTSAELYNPGTRTFSAVGSLNVARSFHTATLLPDGTVLIAGGTGVDNKELATAEIYNPESQTFTLLSNGPCPGNAGCMTTARTSHTATSLLDGTVLIAFGGNVNAALGSTEIYNPKTQTFSAGPSSTPTQGQTATLLQRPTTTIALISSPNPSAAAEKVTLTATVKTGDAVVPVGSVTFQDGVNTLATVSLQLSDNGVAVFSLTSLSVGPHNLTAKYSGDTAHGKSTSSIVVQSVKSQGTTTALRSSPNPSNDGQLVRFVATVIPASSGVPTGSVTFSNNGTPQQTVGLTGNTAIWDTRSLPPGVNAMTATYSGDSSFASSGSPVLTQNVAKLSSIISVTSSPNPASFGLGVLIKAMVTSTGDPLVGNVAFRDGVTNLKTIPLTSGVASFTVSNLSMGSHSITGIYGGDLTHAGAVSVPVQQKITAAASTVILKSSLNPSIYGQNVTFSANVSSGLGVPSGTATFLDGSLRLGSQPLRNGVAALTTATLNTGMHQITATYNGDGSHADATSSPLAQTVNKTSTTTVLSSTPNPSSLGQNVIFRATVSSNRGILPTGTVTFLDGVSVLGKAALGASVAPLIISTLSSGAHDVTASYSGDSNFTPSVSPAVVQRVGGLVTPTIVLTVAPSRAAAGATVTFTARVVYPGGPVPTGSITISDVTNGAKIYGVAPLNNGVGVVKNSTIPVGSYNLVATYGGDGGKHYNGATSNSVPVLIGSPLSTAAANYAPAPCPNPIYGVGFDLGPEFTCGYLTVPENRTRLHSRTIRLAVATRKATAPNPKHDPILFLTGGPGGSGLGEGPGVAKEWHPDRDVIFLDQRGALKSDPFLSCPETDTFMESTVGLSWSAPETAKQSAATVRTCRDRLADAGVDLAAYNTTESASDIADLRIAMGIDRWNIYGISYGTDLALQVLRDHPEGIRSVVIDAVLPPNINPIETGWRAASESATAIYEACAAEPACHAAFPDGRAEYTRVIDDLAARPRTVHVTDPKTGKDATVVIDAYKLSYTVQFGTLIGSPPKIPSMIHDLAVGAGTEAALEVLAGVFPPAFNSYGLQWGVMCREMVGRTDPGRVSAAGKRDLPDFPVSVTAMPSMFPWAFTDCAAWDVPPAPSHVTSAVMSDVPVLLTSGAFDATAPPSYAAVAAKTLKNSKHLVFPGIGHGASRWAPTCFATIMANFLDQPNGFDDSCLAAQKIPPFLTP